MKLLVEKVFEVWEKRIHTVHDTPAPGCYETYEISKSRKVLAIRSTVSAAERYRQTLIRKYIAEGWRDTKVSNKKETRLMDEGASNDIYIWIEERILSEKSIG